MSVRVLFPKGKEPRYVFETLVKNLPEASLYFSRDGIFLKALDPTKTIMFDLEFYSTSLEDYVVEEETKVGLIFTTIKDVIKRIGATEKLELEVDRERNRFSLYIYTKRGREAGLVRRFSFPIVTAVEEEMPELSTSFDAAFEIESEMFSDVLSMAGDVADWVQIETSPNGVVFKSESEGGKAMEVELGLDLVDVYTEASASAKYSVEALSIVDKLKSISKKTRVELSDGSPAKLTHEFSTGRFVTIIAPRVD